MKKKEESSFFVTLLMIVVLVIVFGIAGWMVIRIIEEPHFTIYKEECRNETITDKFCLDSRVYESMGLMQSLGYYSKLIDECKAHNCDSLKEFQDKLDKVLEKSDIFLNQSNPCVVKEEICEPVEVEEIEYVLDKVCEIYKTNTESCMENCFGKGCSFKIWEEKEMDECIKGVNKCQEDCKKELCVKYEYFYTNKSKQDLTIEWLDSNCECWFCGEGYEGEECWLRYCPDDYEINKYKCGDYIVETWGQIK